MDGCMSLRWWERGGSRDAASDRWMGSLWTPGEDHVTLGGCMGTLPVGSRRLASQGVDGATR